MRGPEERQGLSYQATCRLRKAGWEGEGSCLGHREGLGTIQEVGDPIQERHQSVGCKEVGQV